MFDTRYLSELPDLLARMQASAGQLPDLPVPAESAGELEVLGAVADRLGDNYPYAHPCYAGQMLKPPHPVARLAYALAMWVNPNNHALDGGRASSAMEKEAVAALAAMFGWHDEFLGHLTGGGTVANLEALYVAGQLQPGKVVLASVDAHYTHQRISGVLGLPFRTVAVDDHGRMSLAALRTELARGDVGTVVVTLGTTGMGAVDPLEEVIALRERYGFRLHVDAAYGGYFVLVQDTLDAQAARAFAAIAAADSIVVDPHKHGLQPYGCGSVLFRDPAVSRFYAHGSPYTYFSSDDLHLGEISLECSRAGAGAVALWATQRLLPLTSQGEFADGLRASLAAARGLQQRLAADEQSLLLPSPSLDIVVWALRGNTSSAVSARCQALFDEAARNDLHLATIKIPGDVARQHWPDLDYDTETVLCLRSVLMKPDHLAWLDDLWQRYQRALAALPGDTIGGS